MNNKRFWALITVSALTGTCLLFLFLLLGQITVSAAPGENVTIIEARSPSATFTVSGTVTSETTGLGTPDVGVNRPFLPDGLSIMWARSQ